MAEFVPMTPRDFFVLLAGCWLAMLACRCLPLFLLRGRELPAGVADALGLIPPAAFAALVANDLIGPGMFANGLWAGLAPLAAAVIVAVVGRKTGSLIWCGAVGLVAYAILTALPL